MGDVPSHPLLAGSSSLMHATGRVSAPGEGGEAVDELGPVSPDTQLGSAGSNHAWWPPPSADWYGVASRPTYSRFSHLFRINSQLASDNAIVLCRNSGACVVPVATSPCTSASCRVVCRMFIAGTIGKRTSAGHDASAQL